MKAQAKKPAAKKPAAKKPVNWEQLAKRLQRELNKSHKEVESLEEEVQELLREIRILQAIIENVEVNKSWFSRLLSSLKG